MPSINTQNQKLRAHTIPISILGEDDKARMFELMQKYYEDVSREQFLKDLAKKDDIILLLDARRGICGFSTLARVSVQHRGKTFRGIFSGDTVIEEDFRGQRALGKAFLRYLFSRKLHSPFAPLYWLLITKGYKTYLMMANNFAEYYPRLDRETPADIKALMRAFYSQIYPDEYDPDRGLITPSNEACRLRIGVAGISDGLLATNPKIAFFQQANPGWQKGVELACMARMTLWMPFRYAMKAFIVDRTIKPFRNFQASVFGLHIREEKKTDER